MALPDSIPNSEVKRSNADGSVGFPHVRVGHRQIEFSARAKRNPVVSDNDRVFAFANFSLFAHYFSFQNRMLLVAQDNIFYLPTSQNHSFPLFF